VPLRTVCLSILIGACTSGLAATASERTADLDRLERAIAGDPENLKLGADYRQMVIALGEFDRSIDFFRKLAKEHPAGPNVHISLALAYIDKVPTSGSIRRVHLARDAMAELSKAIERQPTVLAYHVRGVINLFFNNVIFKRAKRGIADLEKALALTTDGTPVPLVERVWVALGDGYWRAQNPARAREIWSLAAARFPSNTALQTRLAARPSHLDWEVRHAFDEDIRVDTSLRDVLP
jgi:tetratricopeptide (TPR) repeat protein